MRKWVDLNVVLCNYATMYGACKICKKLFEFGKFAIICNYRFVGAVLFYGLYFMHAIETYRCFGSPYCFTLPPLFELILAIGSYNHTNTHINQLKACVIDYYLIVTHPVLPATTQTSTPTRHNVLRFSQEKNILKNDPFKG